MPLAKPPTHDNEIVQVIKERNLLHFYWHRWFQLLQAYIDTKTPEIYRGTAAPTTTPRKLGDMFIDTTTPNAYIATGTASSADWKLV